MLNACKAIMCISAQCPHERAQKKAQKHHISFCWIFERLFPHHLASIKVTPGLKTLTFPSRLNSMCKCYKSQQAKIQWKSGWETCAHLSLSLFPKLTPLEQSRIHMTGAFDPCLSSASTPYIPGLDKNITSSLIKQKVGFLTSITPQF